MKRVLTLILAAVLMLSLAACGGDGGSENTSTGTTKVDIIGSATSVTVEDIMDDLNSNMARANTKYLNNAFIISGDTITTGEINSDNVLCDHGVIRFKYLLPEEELANLNPGDELKVVGIISSIESSEETWYGGATTNITTVVIDPAYLN